MPERGLMDWPRHKLNGPPPVSLGSGLFCVTLL
jgi:hypothetical protein